MTDTSDREIVISRIINAPRDRVWEAITNPEHLIHWWGPNGFTNTFESIEVKPGGKWKFIMHGPDGVDYPNLIIFKDIEEPSRISYSHSGEEGDSTFESVITLEEEGDGTKVTLTAVFATADEKDFEIEKHGAIEGGKQTLGRLADYVVTM